MGVVGAEEKQRNWDTEEKLLGGRVLGTVVDLLPHVKVVKGTAVEFERHAADIVKHQVRAEHVGHVGEGPRSLLGDAGNDVVEDLEARDQDNVDGPCS